MTLKGMTPWGHAFVLGWLFNALMKSESGTASEILPPASGLYQSIIHRYNKCE